MEYGASRPPSSLGGEDLECDDPRDARHWIGVYTELLGFVHELMQHQSSERGESEMRAMTLQARVIELHLAFWTDRLRRLDKLDQGDDPPQRAAPWP